MSEKIIEKQKTLDELISKKTEKLNSLVEIEKKFSNCGLYKGKKSPNEWMYGLSIDNLKSLETAHTKTLLGEMNVKTKLKKTSSKILEELNILERQISDANFDLIATKINVLLENK